MRIGKRIGQWSLLPASVALPRFCLRSRVWHLRMRRLSRQLENMVLILLTAFGAVFVAEIVGDKLLYTTGLLAARYRTIPIMFGMAVAFMAKMGAAVLVGDAVSKLPRPLVATITALSFLGVAVALWRKPDRPPEAKEKHRASKAAAVSFAAVFLSEWGDVGQITAGELAGNC